MSTTRQGFPKALAALAVAIGIAGGSYGIAAAASGNGSNSAATTQTVASRATPSQPWGGQRPDETLLTGDAASKVTAAALAKVPGEGGQRLQELTRLAGEARTARLRSVPSMLWRLRGTLGSLRDVAGVALPMRVLTAPFLGLTAIAALLCVILIGVGLIALIVLAIA